MYFETVYVTPEIAAEWLQSNDGNRTVKRQTVEQYARDMSAGRWLMTGEPIKFTADSRMLDGQHRCLAVIASGVAVLMAVVRGLDSGTQLVMDSGPSRSAADALKIKGGKSVNQLASIAKLTVHWGRGEITHAHISLKPLSHAEIVAAVDSDPTLEVATALGNKLAHRRNHAGIRATPTGIGFAYWLISGAAGEDKATEFLEDIALLRTSGNGDPRFAAIQRLNSASDNKEQLRNMTQAFIFVMAWNAYRLNKTVSRIQIASHGKYLAFPEPSA